MGRIYSIVAHFISKDLDEWKDAGEPIYVAPDAREPECPDYIEYNNRYYLIYSLGGRAHYKVSHLPFAEWKDPKDTNVYCERVPKGGVWNGEIVFVGFQTKGGYAGTMTFNRAWADENGELVFAQKK